VPDFTSSGTGEKSWFEHVQPAFNAGYNLENQYKIDDRNNCRPLKRYKKQQLNLEGTFVVYKQA